jgi:glutamyl-tRNA synthetase
MGITHVLRGQEHLLNTVQHIALQAAMNYPRPIYAHLPVILNIDGSKMSKRDRDKKIRAQALKWRAHELTQRELTLDDVAPKLGLDPKRLASWIGDAGKQLEPAEQQALMPVIGLRESDLPEIMVHDFRANGYFPETMNNFLALIGWSPGKDRERMTMEEMVRLFSIEGIGRSNAKFDRLKLMAFNTVAGAALAEHHPQRLLAAMRDYLRVNGGPLALTDDEKLATILSISAGFHTLREVDDESRFLCMNDQQITYDTTAVEKVLLKENGQGLLVLQKMLDVLAQVAPWAGATIRQAVEEYCDSAALPLGKVAQPIRVAVSGTSVSPPIFDTLELLGQSPTLNRVNRCINHAQKMTERPADHR